MEVKRAGAWRTGPGSASSVASPRAAPAMTIAARTSTRRRAIGRLPAPDMAQASSRTLSPTSAIRG